MESWMAGMSFRDALVVPIIQGKRCRYLLATVETLVYSHTDRSNIEAVIVAKYWKTTD